jgi:hypothetical protein
MEPATPAEVAVQPANESQAVVAAIPKEILERGERFLELLDKGETFAKAMTLANLRLGQYRMLAGVPGYNDRVAAACRTFKETAKHAVLHRAVDAIVNGDTQEALDKNGDVRTLRTKLDGNLVKTVLAGLDKDFANQQVESGGGGARVVLNVNLPADAMLNITMGNERPANLGEGVVLPKAIDVQGEEITGR